MQILLIEDNKTLADFITKGIKEAGHVIEHTPNGKHGLALAMDNEFSVIVVDRMLPELDGISIVKALRAIGDKTPILFLTALAEVNERVAGLEAGGDDYLVKPFAFSELMARLESLNRRNNTGRVEPSSTLTLAGLTMDLLKRKVTRDGKDIELNPKEFKLLEILVSHPGRVMTRTMLLEKVWGYHFDTNSNIIDVHISNLRKKVDEGFAPPLLHTVRGAGYKADINAS